MKRIPPACVAFEGSMLRPPTKECSGLENEWGPWLQKQKNRFKKKKKKRNRDFSKLRKLNSANKLNEQKMNPSRTSRKEHILTN